MRSFTILVCLLGVMPLRGQSQQGRFCLTYFPQPLVEAYVDSLVNYLTRQLSLDETPLDSTTEQYISHFASLVTRQSKCVYFDKDSILIHEKVDDELTNAYLIVPSENKLISRSDGSLISQSYFLAPGDAVGHYDYSIETFPDDTKLIEGFLCYRLELIEQYYAPEEEKPREKKFVLYVTDDIALPGGFVLGNNMSRLIGCPLEVQEPLNSKVQISYRATGLRLNKTPGIFRSL